MRATLLPLAIVAVPLAATAGAGLRGGQPPPAPIASASEAARLEKELDGLRRDLVRLGRAQSIDEGEAARRRVRLDALNARDAGLRTEIGANRVRLTRLLGALQLYQRDPPPPLFVHAGSARDAARAAVLMKTIAPELRARGEILGRRAEAVRRLRRELAIASEAVMLSESALAERRATIDGLQGEQSDLESNLPGAAEARARARELAAGAGSMSELVGELAEANRTPPLARRLTLSPPVRGQVVRRFGTAAAGTGPAAPGRGSGWTWRTGDRAEVLAPADARVEYVGPLKGYGLVVILTPSEAFHVVLAGLDQAAAGVGRTVVAGEPIGRMAGGGADGAPELYLEVREGGEPVDPARWLAATQSRTAGARGGG